MDFSLNPKLLNKLFAVPATVVDDNIRLAGAAQLKVLLWYLRNSDNNPTVDDASKALGISVGDINDALLYWFDTGVFIKDSDSKEDKSQKEKTTEEKIIEESKPPKKDTIPITPQVSRKPTLKEAIDRGNEDEEVKILLNKSQEILGRTLTTSDITTLVWIKDYLGLPVEVILTAIQFCINRQKGTIRYIEKMLISWADDEIFTLKLAEKKISQIEKSESSWNKIQNIFGFEHRKPSKKEEELANFVADKKISEDLIREAYDITIDTKGKYSAAYILGILKRWNDDKIKTLTDLENQKQKFSKDKDKEKSETTFNLDEYNKRLLEGPKLRKKKQEN
jgi:DnaD/phage-associated family protein